MRSSGRTVYCNTIHNFLETPCIISWEKDFFADRVRDKQYRAYVEDKGGPCSASGGNGVIISGDKVRLRKIDADPIIIDYSRNLFMGAEEEQEMEFGTNEDKVNPKKSIPKLFWRGYVEK